MEDRVGRTVFLNIGFVGYIDNRVERWCWGQFQGVLKETRQIKGQGSKEGVYRK